MAGTVGGDLSTLLAALPAAHSRLGRAVLNHLAAVRGQIGSAHFVARHVGLASRHQLHRRLRHDGLPPIDALAAWVRILAWVTEAEHTHRSLFDIAIRAGLDPPTCYRTVTRITHEHWSTVCKNGSAWVLLRLIDECRNVPAGEKHASEEQAS
jgi:DNA-binding phage protein